MKLSKTGSQKSKSSLTLAISLLGMIRLSRTLYVGRPIMAWMFMTTDSLLRF